MSIPLGLQPTGSKTRDLGSLQYMKQTDSNAHSLKEGAWALRGALLTRSANSILLDAPLGSGAWAWGLFTLSFALVTSAARSRILLVSACIRTRLQGQNPAPKPCSPHNRGVI